MIKYRCKDASARMQPSKVVKSAGPAPPSFTDKGFPAAEIRASEMRTVIGDEMEAKAVRNTTSDHIRKQTGFACGLLLAALLAGCGNVGSTNDVKLRVPYRAQA